MSTFKKLAGIGMSALLAASVFLSGNFTSVSTLDAVAEEAGSVETQPTETQPTENQSEEMAAYLFVHFTGGTGANPRNGNDEQIYFSVSQNGKDWQTLNKKQPVLTSYVGEEGVRDPNIIRSPKGDKFYLIATDLSIWNRNGGWGGCQTNGSKSIVIWESTDLLNWSEPRLKEIARPDAGCTWAPECIWDNEREAYMVFWASKTQDSWTHRIYRCYTEDFNTFTEPELYIESDVSWIDTTFIEHEGTYYRFTKNEDEATGLYIFMEKSTSLSGEFELVSTYSLNGQPAKEYKGYEGPTAYKLNGENKWYLLFDNYSNGGYKAFSTDDISTGKFVSDNSFNFNGTIFRHGSVMPITQSEYDALVAKQKWQSSDGPVETGELIYELNFDNGDLTQSTGNATVSANGGTLTYETGVNGKAVKFDNSSKYISITGANNPLIGLESFTVSFAVKIGSDARTSWWFYAAPNTNTQPSGNKGEQYIGVLTNSQKRYECERYYNTATRPVAATTNYTVDNKWHHVTLVYRADKTSFYIDGERMDSVKSDVNIATMLGSSPIIQLGKANWGNGEYATGWLDEFRIHNYALSVAEVEANYKAVMGLS